VEIDADVLTATHAECPRLAICATRQSLSASISPADEERGEKPSSRATGVRAKLAETSAEKTKPPRISPWGLLFTDPRPLLATG